MPIDGILKVDDGGAWVELDHGGGRFRVTDPTFVDRLLQHVPVRLGGAHLYDDRVQLLGNVEETGGATVISKVARATLFLDEAGSLETWEVPET